MPGELAPVRGRERIAALDVIRGFAILGILVVNVNVFSRGIPYVAPPVPLPDPLPNVLIWTFAEGKFVSTLAFLFGLGFTFQGMRAEAREQSSSLLVRRIAALGLFGLVHAVLIWSGDILLGYAALAFVLLLFRRLAPRTLLLWAGAILAVQLLLQAAFALVLAMAGAPGAGLDLAALAEQAQRAYTSGSYQQMVAQRLRELTFVPFGLVFTGFVFPMMLVGAAVARAGWLRDLDTHRPALRRAAQTSFAIGLPLNFVFALASLADPGSFGPAGRIGNVCWTIGAPALAIAYMATATLFTLDRRDSALVRGLAAVGRLALTNYLLQSIVMTAIFYGLGLFGRVGLTKALGLALILLAIQLWASPLYLERFTYGPAEWLWRRLTYRRL